MCRKKSADAGGRGNTGGAPGEANTNPNAGYAAAAAATPTPTTAPGGASVTTVAAISTPALTAGKNYTYAELSQ